ncbi:MAG: hypothetical protein AAB152_04030 [Candidatus Coatesbacteria bacterium]
MDDTSPEAFRARFREARRKRWFAILICTAMAVLIGREIIWLFLPGMTENPTRWTIILLLPVAWFGWRAGAMAGHEYANQVWKDLQFSQRASLTGARWQSLEQIMAEELGEEEMARRHDREVDAAEDAARVASTPVSDVTSPPKPPGGSSKPEDPKNAPDLPDRDPRQD